MEISLETLAKLAEYGCEAKDESVLSQIIPEIRALDNENEQRALLTVIIEGLTGVPL